MAIIGGIPYFQTNPNGIMAWTPKLRVPTTANIGNIHGATTPLLGTTLGTTQRRPETYIPVSVCSGQAAQGLETWMQLHNRFSIPVGNSRSMQCRVPYKTTYSSRGLTNRSLQSRLQHVPCSSQKISRLRIDVAKSDWHRHLPPRPSLKEPSNPSNRLLIR